MGSCLRYTAPIHFNFPLPAVPAAVQAVAIHVQVAAPAAPAVQAVAPPVHVAPPVRIAPVASAAPATNHDVEIRVTVKKETGLSSWALFLIALFLIAVALISIAVIYLSPEECELVLRILGIQGCVGR
jgi:hypothetical protein